MNNPPSTEVSERTKRVIREVGAALALALVGLLAWSLWSFNAGDPGWRFPALDGRIENTMGRAGAYVSDFLYTFFGYSAWLLPLLLGWSSARMLFNRDWVWQRLWLRPALALALLLMFALLLSMHLPSAPIKDQMAGGDIGAFLAKVGDDMLGLNGTTFICLVLAWLLVPIYLGSSPMDWVDAIGKALIRGVNLGMDTGSRCARFLARVSTIFLARALLLGRTVLGGLWRVARERQRQWQERRGAGQRAAPAAPAAEGFSPAPEPPAASPAPSQPPSPAPESAPAAKPQAGARKGAAKRKRPAARAEPDGQTDLWQDKLPPHSLLAEGNRAGAGPGGHQQSLGEGIIRHLSDYGVKAEITGAVTGPVVTRYEIQPAAGVKASKITGLASDLARSLSVVAVRVVEVIPGKTVVGLEVPNPKREIVRLSEIIGSDNWRKSSGGLPLALGMDIAGDAVVMDLSRMPHLLVAGTTGSGKSVSLNTMMISLLYYGSASQIKMIMIDPKMLELSAYEGIGQLLTPVITDMRQAGKALSWCVREMDRRYALMAAVGVRNVQGYNHRVRSAIKQREPLMDPRVDAKDPAAEPKPLEPMPFIVVVIDEYADMMMVVGKKVETLIMRLSQKARAAGIHLILATQRPSVDVVTGLIKSNIPNRIAFQVSSRVDSRTILDQSGAEQLLGHGDMLIIRPGMKFPLRVHGAFVSDEEVHRVVEYLRMNSPEVDYREDVLADPDDEDAAPASDGEEAGGDGEDATYEAAVKIVRESGRASISYLQRRLRIGYNRSASLLERMEQAGIVSGLQPGGSRDVIGRNKPGE